jgi:ABC-type glycerol-3-phosphate transport system substrate-binding protein
MDIGIIPRFAVGKALVELDKYYEEYPWLKNDLIEAAVESGRVRMRNGEMKLFAVPDELSLLALFYNRDLLEEAGLDPDSPPETWDAFKAMGTKLTVDTDNDGNPDRYAFSMQNTLWWSLPFIYSYGGDIIDEKNMTCLLDQEPAVKALEEQINLYRMGIESGAWKKGAYLPDARFKDHSVAMILSGPWNLRSFDRVNFELALIPGTEEKRSSTAIGGNSNVIFRTCKYPDLAAKFLAYLASAPVQEFFMRELKAIPLNTKVVVPTDQGKDAEYLRIFTEQAKYAQPRPRIPGYGRIETIVNQETETAFRGDRTAQEAYSRACAQIDRDILSELRQGNEPK